MENLTLTLKLPFYRLNQSKAVEFERLTSINTQVANDLLQVEIKERKKLTSAAFRHIEIGSMWINRNDSWFRGFDGYRCNADWNASQNIGQWIGFSCPLDLQKAASAMGTVDVEGGVDDSPQLV
jgi:hypothetical protein